MLRSCRPRTRYLPAGILHARDDHNVIVSRFGTAAALSERDYVHEAVDAADLIIQKLEEMGKLTAEPN